MKIHGRFGSKPRTRSSASVAAITNRVFINSLLFLSSFAPLFVLLAIRFNDVRLKVICAALAFAGTTGICTVLLTASRKKTPETLTPSHLDDRGADVSGYLATYLMPFLVVPDPTIADQVAYALFLAIAGVIYVRSNMLQINPALYILSYRVFAVLSSEEGFHGYVIARGDPALGAAMTIVRLRDKLLLGVS